MPPLLEQLDREALLLLYDSSELDLRDQTEIESRLQSDSSLAAELEQLRNVQEKSFSVLAAADAARPLPMASETALRRVARAMKQWQVDQLAKPPAPAPVRRPFHVPWWAYPSSIAAAIIIGIIIWASNISDPGAQFAAQRSPRQQEQLVQDLEAQWQNSSDHEEEFAMTANSPESSSASTDRVLDEIFMRTEQR